jgi:hypothetical protein
VTTGLVRDRPASRSQSQDALVIDGDPDGHATGRMVVADLKLEPVEQLTLNVLGKILKISIEDRQALQKSRITHLVGLRALCQLGQLRLHRLPPNSDLGEAPLKLVAPLTVDVFVTESWPDDDSAYRRHATPAYPTSSLRASFNTRLALPIGVPASNSALVVKGSWRGLLDQTHSLRGLALPATPRPRRGFLRRLYTM